MAKYYGSVGYGKMKETSPGVWEEEITEVNYMGDVYRDSRVLEKSENLNDNINIASQISILADPYAYENFLYIKYVTFMGIKWKVKTVDLQFPRLILTLGGEYNVQQT